MITLPNVGAILTSAKFLSYGLIHFRWSKMNTCDIIKVLSFASLTELSFMYTVIFPLGSMGKMIISC